MGTLMSTSAWVLHDLGLAAGFGGSLFGKLALHPAIHAIESKEERGKIVNAAWRTYAPINLLGHVAFGLTWLVGRKLLSGRELGLTSRRLVIIKDALVAGSVVTGVASQILGKSIEAEAPEGGVALEPGAKPASGVPERARRKLGLIGTLGTLNLVCNAALIGVTAVLAMQSSRSLRFAWIARLLP